MFFVDRLICLFCIVGVRFVSLFGFCVSVVGFIVLFLLCFCLLSSVLVFRVVIWCLWFRLLFCVFGRIENDCLVFFLRWCVLI